MCSTCVRMEEVRKQVKQWTTHPEFAEINDAFLEAEQFKHELTGCHRHQLGPPALDEKIRRALIIFEEHKDKCLSMSRFTYWLLMALTCKLSFTFGPECIKALGKAIKIRWDFHVLWNELGEQYWLSGEKDLARVCFERALEQGRNPSSLRNMSMVVRNIAHKSAETVEEGIRLAKEAVELNVDDGESWTVLGNAYLTAHLLFNQDKKLAIESLKAFRIAERQEESYKSLDLYHNMAVILKCLLKFDEALEKIEACLRIDKDWDVAVRFKNGLLKFVTGMQESLKKKKMTTKIRRKKAPNVIEWGAPSDRRNLLPRVKREVFKITPFDELVEGPNNDVNIFGHIVWTFEVDETFPFIIGLSDEDGSSTTVHIYNMDPGKLFHKGDALVVRNPVFEKVCFKFLGETIEFTAVRVLDPSALAINGRPLSQACVKPLEATSTVI